MLKERNTDCRIAREKKISSRKGLGKNPQSFLHVDEMGLER